MAAAGVNVNQQGASYIIGVDDTTFYAIKTRTGQMEFQGASAATVIQAAINAVPSSGGEIYIGPGDYLLNTPLLIERSNIRLRGAGYGFWGQWTGGTPGTGTEGEGITKLRATTAIDLVRVVSPVSPGDRFDGIEIDHLYLLGSAKNNGYSGIYAHRIDQLLAHHLFCHRMSYGFRMYDADANRITDSTVMDAGMGVSVQASSKQMLISQNCFWDLDSEAVQLLGYAYGSLITDNQLGSCKCALGMDTGVHSTIFSQNHLYAIREHGVDVHGDRIIISNNLLTGGETVASKAVVNIGNNTQVINVVGNIIRAGTQTPNGIAVASGAADVLVDDNHFVGTFAARMSGTGLSAVRYGLNTGYVTQNSGTSTGTGAQQTIAHGLSATPTRVLLSESTTGGALAYQSAAADATNIYVTAVNTKTWQWEAKVV